MESTPKKRNIEEDRYCQDCKHQTNRPSFCKHHDKYTGRKKTCNDWRRK